MAMQVLVKEQANTYMTDILEGDFTEFYNEYFPRIYQYVHYRIGDYHDACDVTSQIFLKIYEKRSFYCSEKAPLYGWVFCIARNTVIDYCRRHAHNKLITLDAEEDIVDRGLSPEAIVVGNENKHHLHQVVSSLRERERNIITLKYWGGMTNREIAKITCLSESNVAVILFRTMGYLRDIMECMA